MIKHILLLSYTDTLERFFDCWLSFAQNSSRKIKNALLKSFVDFLPIHFCRSFQCSWISLFALSIHVRMLILNFISLFSFAKRLKCVMCLFVSVCLFLWNRVCARIQNERTTCAMHPNIIFKMITFLRLCVYVFMWIKCYIFYFWWFDTKSMHYK